MSDNILCSKFSDMTLCRFSQLGLRNTPFGSSSELDVVVPVKLVIGGREFWTTDAVLRARLSILADLATFTDETDNTDYHASIHLPTADGEAFAFLFEYLVFGKIFSEVPPRLKERIGMEIHRYEL
jgi:hypothetical protein